MNIYKQGLNRKQQQFFPPSLDEYVDEDNPVRAIDSYIELIDVAALGFSNATLGSAEGQPAFHPKLFLKIYIYGYLNKIRSSRNLEKEVKRNVEMMWLTQGLSPSYKSIANFRKDNAKALKSVFKEFVVLCRELELIEGKVVAIDGAFLRANASKNQLISRSITNKRLKEIDEKIENYLELLNTTDQEDKKQNTNIDLPQDIEKLKEKKEAVEKELAFLDKLGKNQYNKTDPDASLMVKPAHNLMAYNAQIAVDDKYKFIVATDVSSQNNDYEHLHTMTTQSTDAIAKREITFVADMGYYSSNGLKVCEDEHINIVVPTPNMRPHQSKGKFSKEQFIYDKEKDCFICPNQKMIHKTNSTITKENGNLLHVYRGTSAVCKACPLRDKCLPQKTAYKSLQRWEHEEVLENHYKKMETSEAKALIKKRGSIVEHPFGTIKRTLGWDHFLVRGKEKVSGENALVMFTYNFKRLLNLIGIALFQKLIIAIKEGDIEAIREEIAEYITHFRLYLDYFLGKIEILLLDQRKLVF